MGFEPILNSSGLWEIGTAGKYTIMNKMEGRPIAATQTGSYTSNYSSWTRVMNSNVLQVNKVYLIDFSFDTTGNPWNFNMSFLYSTVAQNGTCAKEFSQMPFVVHADNGVFTSVNVKAGDGYGGAVSGIDVQIRATDGRVGTYTTYAYLLGDL